MTDKQKFPIERISYSALSNFNHCPKYFELVNIKKLQTKGSPEMAFGTLLHRHVQSILTKEDEIENSAKNFKKIWTRFCKFYKLDDKFIKLIPTAEKVIYYVTGFLTSHFGNKFKVLHIEYKIHHKILDFPQNFKGFIDLVLELENGEIIIIDIKTTNSVFFFNKYKDKFKEYQLSFYKIFYSEIEKVEKNKIKTYFVVIEKALDSKKPLTLIEVSSGDVKLANAQQWLSSSLKSINAERFVKNHSSCLKYGEKFPCMFLNTEHCKKGYKR